MGRFILIFILTIGIIFNIFVLTNLASGYNSAINTDTIMPAGISLDNKGKDSLSLEDNNDRKVLDKLDLIEENPKEENNLIRGDLFFSTKRILFGIISSLGLEGTQEQKELEESTE